MSNREVAMKTEGAEMEYEKMVESTIANSSILPVLSGVNPRSSTPPVAMPTDSVVHTPLSSSTTMENAILQLPFSSSSNTPSPPSPQSSDLDSLHSPRVPHIESLSHISIVEEEEQQIPKTHHIDPNTDTIDPPRKDKKRSRSEVDYSRLDAGIVSDEEEGKESEIKRAKIAPSAAVVPTSSPLHISGATRRFGSRIATLLEWFDSMRYVSEEEIKIPNVSLLADICTDLHTVDLSSAFSSPDDIPKTVASLRYVNQVARGRIGNFDTTNPASTQASELQSGMLSTVCLLYLLNSPSFDRKYLSDECLDESCVFLSLVLSSFLPAMLDYSASYVSFTDASSHPSAIAFSALTSKGKPSKQRKTAQKSTVGVKKGRIAVKNGKNTKKSDEGVGMEDKMDPFEKKEGKETPPILQLISNTPYAALTSHIMTLLYESLEHLTSLTKDATTIPEEHVTRLLKITKLSNFSHGLQSLHSPARRLMRIIWLSSPSHRSTIIQDMFESIVDMERGPFAASTLLHGSLHIVTSTLLFLLQSNHETLVSDSTSALSTEMDDSTTEGWMETKFSNSRQRVLALGRNFLKYVFEAVVEYAEVKEDTYSVVLERVVMDLTQNAFKPEFPVAETLLRDCSLFLLSYLHPTANINKDLASSSSSSSHSATPKLNDRLRHSFGVWLGIIGTKLVSIKLYMSTANMVQRQPVGSAESRLHFENGKCPLCTQGYTGKTMASCSRCMRWFHAECYGITTNAHDSKADWFCDSCLIGFVSDMLSPDLSSAHSDSNKHLKDSNTIKSRNGESEAENGGSSYRADEGLDLSIDLGNNDMEENGEDEEASKRGEEEAKKREMIHSAMKVLLINYMNDSEGIEIEDAKRYMIRQWRLEEQEVEGGVMEEILKTQCSTLSPPEVVTWPLGAAWKYDKEKVEENGYIRRWWERKEGGFEAKTEKGTKRGQLPSRLACQVFLTRFSMTSKVNYPSIFAYFGKIVEVYVGMMNSEYARQRALALRVITNMVDADMSLLREESVYRAVEARLIDASALTREKALNMLGRFILLNPSVLPHYCPLLSSRLSDSAISVRKRAIRIIRSVCFLVPNSPLIVDLSVSLSLNLIPQLSDSILSLFRDMWFSDDDHKTQFFENAKASLFDPELPQADLSSSMTATDDDDSLNEQDAFHTSRLSPSEKVDQILSVLQETIRLSPDREPTWLIELLTFLLSNGHQGAAASSHQTSSSHAKPISRNKSITSVPTSSGNHVPGSMQHIPFVNECVRALVDFLSGVGEESEREHERTLKCEQLVEEHASNPMMRRAAQAALAQNKEDVVKKKWIYSVALSHFAQVMPQLVAEHFHQLRLLVACELPTPTTHTIEKKKIETFLAVLSAVIPHIRQPSDDVWASLLKDLSQLLRHHGMPVIAAAIKCAAAVAQRTSDAWLRSLYNALAYPLRQNVERASKREGRREGEEKEEKNRKLTQSPSVASQLNAQTIIRFLFTLGMILKCNPLDAPQALRERDLKTVDSIRAYRYGPHVEEVYSFIVHYWKEEDRDIKTSAVLTLGHLAPSSPGIFLRLSSQHIISSALHSHSLEQLKAQAIKTIHEFLTQDSLRMKSDPKSASPSLSSLPSRSSSRKSSSFGISPKESIKQDDESLISQENAEILPPSIENDRSRYAETERDTYLDQVMEGDVFEGEEEENSEKDNLRTSSSASKPIVVKNGKVVNEYTQNDTGLSSTIVELYIKRVLTLGLDKSIAIRSAALGLVEQVLKMGLTHPAHCVPMLVALETDEVLGDIAHRCLANLEIGRILNRIAIGIQTSFMFQKTIYRTPKAIREETKGTDSGATSYHSTLGRLYLIFADAGRVARNNFLAAAFGLFEAHADSTSFEALFVTYLTLLLAQLPFSTLEEALFAVFQINRAIANIGNSAFSRLKTFYASLPNNDANEAQLGNSKHKAKNSTNIANNMPPLKDAQDAIVTWHLFAIKRFLRSFYGLTADRCKNYMPSDASISPIAKSVTSVVNIQEYLADLENLQNFSKPDARFQGFLLDSDWQKRPESIKRIYKQLKVAFKYQDSDVGLNSSSHHSSSLLTPFSANASTSSAFNVAHPSPKNATKPKPRRKSSAGTSNGASQVNKTSSASNTPSKVHKPKAKPSSSYYNSAKDEDYEG